MPLRRLQVTDLRCLHSAAIELDPRFTLISGPNGSGKTTLLEAMYLLGRGRSFRTRRLERLIRAGAQRFIVFVETELTHGRLAIGIEGSKLEVRARIGGREAASIAELAASFPVQVIDPEIHQLIEQGPGGRRRLIDWGVFHVEHTFLPAWQRYRQALVQRNAALRIGAADELLAAWEPELLRTGKEIHEARGRYVRDLESIARPIVRRLIGVELELRYRSGWTAELDFATALRRSLADDRRRGATQVGPHRAELVIRANGMLARDHVSRGQQKLLAAALSIAQLRLLQQHSAERAALLLDDPAAELDAERLHALIGEVQALDVQLVVTTLQPAFAAFGHPGRRWNIVAGDIQDVQSTD